MGLHAAEPVHHHHHYHHHLFFFFGEIKNCLRKCRAAPTLSHRCTHGQVAFIGVSSSAHSLLSPHYPAQRLKLSRSLSAKSLLRHASASPLWRMKPAKASMSFFPVIFPDSSTSAISIWTEAWSLAVMSLFVAEHFLGI